MPRPAPSPRCAPPSFDLVRYAKASGAALILVGHVTKDGQIAGPKAVEHLVDAVLYFEGERGHHFRVLRAVKNRFGATDEIGVFEMTGKGLAEVANPSALFLGDRNSAAPGTAVFAGLEGTRPLLCEIQALVAPTGYGTPRRAVVGWDTGRLAMILAVLDARAGLGIGGPDVYLNVAGGLKIGEPAADLAAAAALDLLVRGRALAAGQRVFRRDQPVRRHPPGAAGRAAAEGSRQAGLQDGLRARGHQDRRRRPGVDRGYADVAELLALVGAGTARATAAVVESNHESRQFTVRRSALIVLVVLVSAGYAAWRGFVSETLSIFAWAAAAFATLYFGPWLAPHGARPVSPPLAGDARRLCRRSSWWCSSRSPSSATASPRR